MVVKSGVEINPNPAHGITLDYIKSVNAIEKNSAVRKGGVNLNYISNVTKDYRKQLGDVQKQGAANINAVLQVDSEQTAQAEPQGSVPKSNLMQARKNTPNVTKKITNAPLTAAATHGNRVNSYGEEIIKPEPVSANIEGTMREVQTPTSNQRLHFKENASSKQVQYDPKTVNNYSLAIRQAVLDGALDTDSAIDWNTDPEGNKVSSAIKQIEEQENQAVRDINKNYPSLTNDISSYAYSLKIGMSEQDAFEQMVYSNYNGKAAPYKSAYEFKDICENYYNALANSTRAKEAYKKRSENERIKKNNYTAYSMSHKAYGDKNFSVLTDKGKQFYPEYNDKTFETVAGGVGAFLTNWGMFGGKAGGNFAYKDVKKFEDSLENPVAYINAYRDKLTEEKDAAAWLDGETLLAAGIATPEYMYMTEEEQDIYSYYAASEGREAADKYFNSILDNLKARREVYRQENNGMESLYEWSAKNDVTAAVASIPLNLLGGAAAFNDIPEQIITGDGSDSLSRNLMLSSAASTMRAGALSDDSELGGFAAGVGLSIADNLLVAATFGPYAAPFVMAGTTMGNSYNAAIQSGSSSDEAMLYGLTQGLSEYVTEKIPFDRLIDIAKSGRTINESFLRNVLEQAGVEFGEETVNSYISTLSDIAVRGDNSDYNQRIQYLMVEEGMSYSEAKSQAELEFFVVQPLQDGLAGFVSGGVTYSIYTGANTAAQHSEKKKIEQAVPYSDKILNGEQLSVSEKKKLLAEPSRVRDLVTASTGVDLNGDYSTVSAKLDAAAKINARNAAEQKTMPTGGTVTAIAQAKLDALKEQVSNDFPELISENPVYNNDREVINPQAVENLQSAELADAMESARIIQEEQYGADIVNNAALAANVLNQNKSILTKGRNAAFGEGGTVLSIGNGQSITTIPRAAVAERRTGAPGGISENISVQLDAIETISAGTGVPVYLYDGGATPAYDTKGNMANGFTHRNAQTGKVEYIAIDIRSDAPVLYLFGHETFHAMGKESESKLTRALSDYLGETLTVEQAADKLGENLCNVAFCEYLVGKNRPIAQRVLDFIRSIIARLKGQNVQQLTTAQKTLANALSKKIKNNTQSESSAENQYMTVADSFARGLDKWDKSGRKTGGYIHVGMTSEVLQGVGMKAQELYIDKSKLKKILSLHEHMNIDIIKQVPYMLEDPIAVLESAAHPNRVVAVGELYDTENKPVLAAVEMNLSGSNKSDISKIITAYGKNNLQSIFNNDRLLYLNPDKKRTTAWSRLLRLQLPAEETNRSGYMDTITPADRDVNGNFSTGNDSKFGNAMEEALKKAGVVDRNKTNDFMSRSKSSMTDIGDGVQAKLIDARARAERNKKFAAEYELIARIAKRTRTKVQYVSSVRQDGKNINGTCWYNRENGTIYLNISSDKALSKMFYRGLLHHIAEAGSKGDNAFVRTAYNYIREYGKQAGWSGNVIAQINEILKADTDTSRPHAAFEEVLADKVADMFADENFMRYVSRKNMNFLQKLWENIKNYVIRALGGTYAPPADVVNAKTAEEIIGKMSSIQVLVADQIDRVSHDRTRAARNAAQEIRKAAKKLDGKYTELNGEAYTENRWHDYDTEEVFHREMTVGELRGKLSKIPDGIIKTMAREMDIELQADTAKGRRAEFEQKVLSELDDDSTVEVPNIAYNERTSYPATSKAQRANIAALKKAGASIKTVRRYGYQSVAEGVTAYIADPTSVPMSDAHNDNLAAAKSLAGALGFERIGFYTGQIRTVKGREIKTSSDAIIGSDGTLYVDLKSETPYTAIVGAAWFNNRLSVSAKTSLIKAYNRYKQLSNSRTDIAEWIGKQLTSTDKSRLFANDTLFTGELARLMNTDAPGILNILASDSQFAHMVNLNPTLAQKLASSLKGFGRTVADAFSIMTGKTDKRAQAALRIARGNLLIAMRNAPLKAAMYMRREALNVEAAQHRERIQREIKRIERYEREQEAREQRYRRERQRRREEYYEEVARQEAAEEKERRDLFDSYYSDSFMSRRVDNENSEPYNESGGESHVRRNERFKETREAFESRARREGLQINKGASKGICCGYRVGSSVFYAAKEREIKKELSRLTLKGIAFENDLMFNNGTYTYSNRGNSVTLNREFVAIGVSEQENVMEHIGHEAFHVWAETDSGIEFNENVINKIVLGDEFELLFEHINECEFEFGYDADLEKHNKILREELVAYISGMIHSGQDVSGLLENPDEVIAAWNKLVEEHIADTPDDGSDSFMSSHRKVPAAEVIKSIESFDYDEDTLRSIANQIFSDNTDMTAEELYDDLPDIIETLLEENPKLSFEIGSEGESTSALGRGFDELFADNAEAVEKSVRRFERNEKNTEETQTIENKTPAPIINQNEQIRERYQELRDRYGTIPQGEDVNSRGDVGVPRRTEKNNKIRQGARTFAEAENVPEVVVGEIEREILKGMFSYTPLSDKVANNYAKNLIESDPEEALREWDAVVRGTAPATKNKIALAENLIIEAAAMGDTDTAVRLIAEVAAEGTRAGQAVQAFRMVKRLSPTGQLLALQKAIDKYNRESEKRGSYIELPKESLEEYGKMLKELENLQRRITGIENELPSSGEKGRLRDELDGLNDKAAQKKKDIDKKLDDLKDETAQLMPKTWTEKFNAWRYLSMLGNPRTHIRNILGNAVFAPTVTLKSKIAAVIESGVRSVNKGFERSQSITASKALKEFAAKDAAENLQQLANGGKYNAADELRDRQKIFSQKNIVGRALNKASEFNSAMLEAEDGIFLRKRYTYALAHYCAANKWNVAHLNANPADLQRAREFAFREAQRATYRDTNAFSQAMTKISNDLRNSRGAKRIGYWVMEGAIPFKKTPANIVKRGVEYSPIGILNTLLVDSGRLKRGEITGSDYINNLAAGMTGTMVMALGYFLASLGVLRGRSKDKEDEFEELQGAQEWSVVLGDTSYTIDWLAPVSLPLFVGVELQDQIENSNDKMDMNDVFDALTSISEPIFSLSMMDGLQYIMQSYSSEGAISNMFIAALQSFAGQMTPTIFGQVARTIDDTSRNAYYNDKTSWWANTVTQPVRNIIAKIPGASRSLPARVDAWGRTTAGTTTAGERALQNFISPGYWSKDKSTPVDKEIQKIYDETDRAEVLPKNAPKSFSVGGETYYLSSDEYESFAIERGQTAYAIIDELINNKVFANLDADKKADAIEKAYDVALDCAKVNTQSGYTANSSKAMQAFSKYGVEYSDYVLFSALCDGTSQAAAYTALKKMYYLTDAERSAIWDTRGWKKTYSEYKAEQ